MYCEQILFEPEGRGQADLFNPQQSGPVQRVHPALGKNEVLLSLSVVLWTQKLRSALFRISRATIGFSLSSLY